MVDEGLGLSLYLSVDRLDHLVHGLSRYASSVKLITNAASKNADNKEIVRLKGIIAKLKKDEEVKVDEEV